MKITCVCCAREINLDHKVFENYAGPIKCFRCGSLMQVRTEEGSVSSLVLSPHEDEQPARKAVSSEYLGQEPGLKGPL